MHVVDVSASVSDHLHEVFRMCSAVSVDDRHRKRLGVWLDEQVLAYEPRGCSVANRVLHRGQLVVLQSVAAMSDSMLRLTVVVM
jgi:hypothetical protein